MPNNTQQKPQKAVFSVSGMMCPACEAKVERAARAIQGVSYAKADYVRSIVTVEFFDSAQDVKKAVEQAIENAGYSVQTVSPKEVILGIVSFFGAVAALYALYYIAGALGLLDIFYNFPQAEETAGFTALFLIGLFTSVHCIGMCGGINLSVSCGIRGRGGLGGTFAYNAARAVSYTIIGGIAGAIGSVVGFSGTARGVIAVLGGIFMIIMGLNMLNVFPFLRVLTVRFKLPAPIAKVFAQFDGKNTGKKSGVKYALIVGLLNGLMPCGPLQTMQLYALSTGSAAKGALSMFLFSIGTVPLMVTFGSIGSLLTKKAAKILTTVSAALVILLGIELFRTGLAFAG